MLFKDFRLQNFRGPSWTEKVPEIHRESGEFPTTFGSPCCAANAAWRPCFAENFCFQNFRGPPFEEEGSEDNLATTKGPKTNRDSGELCKIFGSPRRASNAAWRPCFSKISVSKIFADQVGRRRFQRYTANPGNFPQFLAPRVLHQTLRGAHVSLKFLFRKFSRTELDEEGSKDEPRIPGISHNFWFPALCFQPQLLVPHVNIRESKCLEFQISSVKTCIETNVNIRESKRLEFQISSVKTCIETNVTCTLI